MSSKSKRKLTSESTRASSPENSDVSRRPSVFERLGPGAPSIPSQTSERASGDRNEKCRNWLRTGSCCYGSSCRYQHGPFNSPSHRSKKERERAEKDLRHKVKNKKEDEGKEAQKQRSPSPAPKQKEPKPAPSRSRKSDHDGKIKSTVVVTRLRSPASDQTEREKQQTGSWEDDSDDWPLDVSQLDYKEELTLERKRQQLQRELAELEIQKERILNDQESVIITKTVSLGDSSSSQSGSSTSSSGSSGSSSSSDDSDDDNSSSVSTSSQSQMHKKSRKLSRDHEPVKSVGRKGILKESEAGTSAKLSLPKDGGGYTNLSPPHEKKSKKRSKDSKELLSAMPEWKTDHPDDTSKSSIKSRGPHTPSPPRSKGEKALISSGRDIAEENWKNKRHKRKHESSPVELSSHLPPLVSSCSPPRHHRKDAPQSSSKKEKEKEKSKKSNKESEGKSKKKAKESSPAHGSSEKQFHSSSKQESIKKGHTSPYHNKRESDGKKEQSSHSSSHQKSSEYRDSSKHKDRLARDSSSKKSKGSEKDRSGYRRDSYSPSHKKLDSYDAVSRRSVSPNDHPPPTKGEKRKRSPSPREKDGKSKDFKRMLIDPVKSRDDVTHSASPVSGDMDYPGTSRSKSRKSDDYSRQDYLEERRDSSRSKHDREKDGRSDRPRNSDSKASSRRQDRKSPEKHGSEQKSKVESRSSRDSMGQRSSLDRRDRDRSRDNKEGQRKREREKEIKKSSPHHKASPSGDQPWMESSSGTYKGSSRRSYNDRRKSDRDRDKEREADSRREPPTPQASLQDIRSQSHDGSRESRSKDNSHHRDSSRRRDGRQYGSDKKSHKDRETSQRDLSPAARSDDVILPKDKVSSHKRSPLRESTHEKPHLKERRSHRARSKERTPPPLPPPPPPPPLPPKQTRETSPANSSSTGSWEDNDKRVSTERDVPLDIDRNTSQILHEKSQNEAPRIRHEQKVEDIEPKQEVPAPVESPSLDISQVHSAAEPSTEIVVVPEGNVELGAKTDPISPVSENSSVPASPVPESHATAPLSPVSIHEEEKDKERANETKDILSGVEEFSDWSDDDDDLLTREEIPEDSKHWGDIDGEYKAPEALEQTSPGTPHKNDIPTKELYRDDTKSTNKAVVQELIEEANEFVPATEKSSYHYDTGQMQQQQKGHEFEDDLGEFDPISDDELEALIEEPDDNKPKEEESRVGIVDALDVDWSQLMSDPKPLPKFIPGSARKMFTPAAVLSRIGFSRVLAGERLSERIISECEKELKEAINKSDEGDKAVPVNTQFVLEHPIASFHAAIVKRRQERANIIHNVGPYRRALCARQDLKIRQFLCKPNHKIFDTSTSTSHPHPVDKELYKLSLQYLHDKKSTIKPCTTATSVEVSC